MKKWLLERFLPMWAKESVLRDNRQLKRQIRLLEQELEGVKAYVRGLETGIRSGKRVQIFTGGKNEHLSI